MTVPTTSELLQSALKLFDENSRKDIEMFLAYMQLSIMDTKEDLLEASSGIVNKQIRGQLTHYDRQIGTIEWLRAVNRQRKSSNEVA